MAELDGGRAAVSCLFSGPKTTPLLINVAMARDKYSHACVKTLAISKAAAFVVVQGPLIYEQPVPFPDDNQHPYAVSA